MWQPSLLPYHTDIETKSVLKQTASAHRALAELKGLAQTIPRPDILINTLIYQEAKDSSEVENIVTTHDDIFKSSLDIVQRISPETKEVQNYVSALKRGYDIVAQTEMLRANDILEIQETLEKNKAGYRKLPGTSLKNQKTGDVIYSPPQHIDVIEDLMLNLEVFINDPEMVDYDPLVKMAVIHFQFESIHPFYDGNGRTGRIINILYLVIEKLLSLPILYLSRYIIKNKAEYYNRLQGVRDHNDWEGWLMFILKGVEVTAIYTSGQVHSIRNTMQLIKNVLRKDYKFYSQELLNHLFKQPYTKIEFLVEELKVTRVTAANYLNAMSDGGVLEKHKIGKTNYYVNYQLMNALKLFE